MKPKTTHIPEIKKKTVSELTKLSKEKKTILIASIKNIPGSQFQEIVKKLRGKAIVKVPKRSLTIKAMDNAGEKDLEKLKKEVVDSSAILFSDLDAFELGGYLMKYKSPSKAKPGQVAPNDIEIQAGPTELVPGPAISELGSVGLQVQVENGKLTIKESRVIVKKGDKIKQKEADIMSKLGIMPFSIGFKPVCAFDNESKTFYSEINIDVEGTINDLKYCYSKALPFAVSIEYLSKDTIGFILGKAQRGANKINRILTGEPEEVAPAVEETPKEEKKEEPKVDAAAGLAGLFG